MNTTQGASHTSPVQGPLALGAVLVVLGQFASLANKSELAWINPLDGLFAAQGAGVSILLTALGWWSLHTFERARAVSRRGVAVEVVCFAGVITLGQVLVLLAVWLGDAVEDGPASRTSTQESMLAANVGPILTFRFNLWAAGRMLEVRPELSVLTIFGLVTQLVALVALAVLLLPDRVRRPVIGVVAAVGSVAIILLRVRAQEFQDPFVLALDTFARADAFLIGVLAHVLATWWRDRPASLAGAGLLGLAGGVLATSFVSTSQFFNVQLPGVAVCAALVLLGSGADAAGTQAFTRIEGSSGVTRVAASWVSLIAWSGPVAVVLARHTQEMNWTFRLLVGVLVLVALVRLTEPVLGVVRALPSALSLKLSGGRIRRLLDDTDRRLAERSRQGSAEVGDVDRGAGRDQPPGA